MRGASGSATGTSSTSLRTLTRPCVVSGECASGDETFSHLILYRPRVARSHKKKRPVAMTESPAKAAFIVRSSEARLIRALVADDKDNSFSATTFLETQVERVMEPGTDRSASVLLSGLKIPVALKYEQLEQKIYSPNIRTDDSFVLDLRDVTGPAAKAANSNPEAKPKAPANSNQAPAPTYASNRNHFLFLMLTAYLTLATGRFVF
jgi:hypothetical protein